MKKIIFLILFFIAAATITMGAFLFMIFTPANSASSENEIVFTIIKGEGLEEISANLEELQMIHWAPVFQVYARLSGSSKRLQAGNYLLSSKMSTPEILEKFTQGDVEKIVITIPEGWTQKKIEEKMNLKLPGENLEGFLFPDTYYFPFGVGGEEVVEKMKDNFDKKLTPELREEIAKQGKTVFEIVTMASIIEKEVISYEDRQIVSGIFWKRIAAGMPLDSCATIAYILGVDKKRYSYEDTRVESPYNTYLHKGLPPGPICNPGLDSIMAAIYPETSPYWYFLSIPAASGEPRPDGREGETIFSKTFAQHNAAIAKYLK